MTSNNEESAFPRSRLGSDADGMTLRDYFAAKAMQQQINGPLDISNNEAHRVIAERAYRLAEAMLEERKKRR